MKTKLFSFLVVSGLVVGGMSAGLGGSTDSAQAQPNTLLLGGQAGGAAAGLIAAVVQLQNVSANVHDVVDINNNRVLNNSLNHLNVEVLRDGIVIQNFLNNVNVDVLNDLNIEIDDIVAIINVLGGGFVVVT